MYNRGINYKCSGMSSFCILFGKDFEILGDMLQNKHINWTSLELSELNAGDDVPLESLQLIGTPFDEQSILNLSLANEKRAKFKNNFKNWSC